MHLWTFVPSLKELPTDTVTDTSRLTALERLPLRFGRVRGTRMPAPVMPPVLRDGRKEMACEANTDYKEAPLSAPSPFSWRVRSCILRVLRWMMRASSGATTRVIASKNSRYVPLFAFSPLWSCEHTPSRVTLSQALETVVPVCASAVRLSAWEGYPPPMPLRGVCTH